MIEIRSFNQILGNMVRKIVAETPLSDVNPGSVFLSLLEACASNDFENNVAILNILELLNVDSIRNNDLDNKAADYGLVRKSATPATGTVTIYNSKIAKQSSSLYSLKPAPIAGQTVLFLTQTEGWASQGTLYIGRGTTSFEGPIPYTAIQQFATYSQVTLGAVLQKDHLSSDLVVNAQGQSDRLIPAGTAVKIPANNQSPEILYNTLRDAVLPAGEDKVEGVLVVAKVPGTRGNALINTIRQFDSVPFVGATVSNVQAFTTGTDVETDVELRNRIKSYTASLARGTSPAILSAVIGLSDPDENKRVASAVLSHPVSLGEPSILHVDDGSGFQPSFTGQPVDVLLSKANGTEEFLQLANYPLPRPQVINNALGPFSMKDQMFLRVAVDGDEDVILFTEADFVNISVATVFEIVAAINAQATLFRARLANNSTSILLYPLDANAETIQVMPLRNSEDEQLYANNLLNFSTREASYIALYQNNTRLHQRAKPASVETVSFAAWNLLSSGNLILSVDGTPAQDGAFSLSDFQGVSSFSLLTLDNWVTAINAKFAGITAEATPGQTLRISSNRSGNSASVEILGGTYQAPMFATNAMFATGRESNFEINRQTGNIRILTDIEAGDTISAGVTDVKGFVVSSATQTGSFNLDTDADGRESQLVIVTDCGKCNRVSLNAQIGDSLTISDRGNSVMRITASNNDVFHSIQPGNFIYVASRSSGWLTANNCGLFRVITRGAHTTAGTNSYIEVHNNSITAETVTITKTEDLSAFEADSYPQIWRASSLDIPAATTVSELVDSLNELQGVQSTVFRTTAVKITSTTEEGGSIAIPVAVGRISAVFTSTATKEANNDPLVANKVTSKDLLGFPKLADITSGNTFLSRTSYPLVGGALTANSTQDSPPYSGSYAETLEATDVLTDSKVDMSDIVVFTGGDNKGLVRSIAAKPATDTIGTQQGVPRTLFNHVTGDEVTLFQSLRLGADDNIVYVMDNDATVKTVDVNASRTGKVNSGSDQSSFVPTSTEFSADDRDNESGIDFSTLNVWGTEINNTDFSDYTVAMKARNWYASGGTASAAGKFLLRATEFGTNGNNLNFSIEYPSTPDQTAATVVEVTPSSNLLTYYFGSGPARTVGLTVGNDVTITSAGSNLWDIAFSKEGSPTGDFSGVQVNDVFSVVSDSGIPITGTFNIQSVAGSTLRIYDADSVAGTYTLTKPALVQIFPLTGTAVSDIADKVNASTLLSATAIGPSSATVVKATREDIYSYVSDATALGHNHNPGENKVALFDGINWVKSFQNANPNFTLKVPLELVASGVDSSIYSLVGEEFKLIPTTVANVQHHLTQKALSQLPILSRVDLANKGKRVQIASKQLGSSGGVRIAGGEVNLSQTDLLEDAQTVAAGSNNYLLASVSAFPNSYSAGDVVKLQNRSGVRRKSSLSSDDSISVVASGNGFVDYLWNAKAINFTATTTITITDVSYLYKDYAGNALVPGMVFRWTHSTSGSESLANVRVGDVVAMTTASGWGSGNISPTPGDEVVSGFPIVAVNDASHYLDVVNPRGAEMAAKAIGTGSLSVFATPQVRWNLSHLAPTGVSDSTHTRYRLEKLGINNLVRLRHVGGTTPRFADAGVAVDDYLVISGTTFSSLNNGIFRVIAVDNYSVVFENSNAVENLNTLIPFNNSELPVSWTANNKTLTGVAGTFENLQTGMWVKKQNDEDSLYVQVTGCNTSGNYATATQVFLGSAYAGITGSSYGTAYDQTTGFGGGALLNSVDDVAFYEGDSALINDKLFVQSLTDINWFSTGNCGSFDIVMTGTDATHRPMLRVRNSRGVTESNRLMSVNSQGFYITESNENKFSSYRLVTNSTVNPQDELKRSLYMLPDSHSDKFSDTNGTFITHTGKLGFDLNASTGTDGYLFYTGLLRRVQRTIDGYGPDSTTFPERRAIGSSIEALPPLIKNLSMVLTITTDQGFTIQDVGNNVKSAVIDYVNNLGVGQACILSAVIARVMQVRGVAAVTFNVPDAKQERISVAPNEKAVITADNIGVN